MAQSGGFVLLETEVDVGTTFSLYLPVAAVPAEAKAPTILLAEDEEIVRDLTEQILKNAGYAVLTANDGTAALALYEEHRSAIDGVVTDIVMPGIGGRGLAREIRERDAELPIVFISGHHEETAETLQLGTGAALLQKPFSVAALVEAIGRLLGEEPSPAAVSSLPSLTPREREILGLVANGLTNDRVATTLAISPETVQSHCAQRDGGARSRHEDGGRRNGTPSLAHRVRPTAAAERCGCRASARPTRRRAPSPARRSPSRR